MSTTTSGGRPRDLGIEGYADFVRVGAGGYSTVYRARQELFDRDVAVKILSVQVVDDTARRRFRRECSAAGRISDHPNVATLLDAGFTATGSPYITSEFCPGGSLADALRRRGPLPPAEVLDIGIKLAVGLQAVHDAGVLHRDIKPANILVSAYGEPMLSDFGIALAEAGVTATGANVATPYYTAPEVVTGAAPTIAGDIYALCASLYELLTGSPPHAGGDVTLSELLRRIQCEPIAQIERADVSAELRDVLARGLSRNPVERQLTAQVLADELAGLEGPVPTEAPSPVSVEVGPAAPLSRARRVPGAVLVVGGVLVLLLAAVGLITILTRGEGGDEVIVVESEGGEHSGGATGGVIEPPPNIDTFLAMLGGFRLGGDEIHAELVPVQDDSGFLTLQIPVTWGDVYTSGDEVAGSQLDGVIASADAEEFEAFGQQPGVEILRVPGVEPTAAQLTALLDEVGLPDDCASAGPVVAVTAVSSGVAQAFQGCTMGDGVFVTALLAGPDPSYSVFVGVQLQSDADLALADQYLVEVDEVLAASPSG